MSKSFIELINRLMRRVPGKAWFAVGGLLVGAFWLQQHDARIRQQARLKQLRSQTTVQVGELRRQAAQAVRQANEENAKAIAKLEQRRQQVQQQNRKLAAQLDRLRKQARLQADQVATLPISKIVTRVAAQLGPKAVDVMPPASSAEMAKAATSAPAGGKVVALPLTASGARKVETALVELNACRAESSIETQQISTCHARAEADEAEVKRLHASVASLNQALAAKDKILAHQATEYKAELRAVRGTFLGRLARVTEHVAVGLALGVAIGVAVK